MPISDLPVFEGSTRQRIKANLEAVASLQGAEIGDVVDREELVEKLSRFTGWGSLTHLFDEDRSEYDQERSELIDLIGAPTFHSLGRGVLDSYYTPQPVIESIWQAITASGFEGGTVLEPGCGAGYFRRFMPEQLTGAAEVTGVEKDSVAARIAKLLFRDTKVLQRGYEDCNIVNSSFDLVVGNVPFGDTKVSDPIHRDLRDFSIHNYFLSKSIQKLRPGGLMAVVVSRYFMDAINPSAREFIDRHADLLGAVRLPAGVFRGCAGTDVVADVVVFQRRGEDLPKDAPASDWTVVRPTDVGSDRITMGSHFIDHPEHVLGALETRSGRYGLDLHVSGSIDAGLWQRLDSLLASFTANAMLGEESGEVVDEAIAGRELIDSDEIPNADECRDGELIALDDGRIAECVSVGGGHQFVNSSLTGKKAERAKGMINLAVLTSDLLRAEAEECRSEMDRLRDTLNADYDAFVKAHGPVSGWANQLVFRVDPRNPLVASLEDDFKCEISPARAKQIGCEPRKATWKKAAIFSRPINIPRRPETPETPSEALVRSLVEYGRVNLAEMAGWLDTPESELIAVLAGRIFRNPENGRWETRDVYLGGNVRRKLAVAEQAAEIDSLYAANVEALTEALPDDIPAADIHAPINAAWLPGDVIAEFLSRIFGEELKTEPRMVSGEWVLNMPRIPNDRATKVWGTECRPAYDLIDRMMNNRELSVYDTFHEPDGSTKRVFNADETAAAQAKADDIRDEWEGWIWACPERRRRLERIYNDAHNTHVDVDYDGAFLLDKSGRLPGMSNAISLRKTQVNAIWQGVCVGSTLMDHRVGAGKTFAAVAQVMEMRRMGLLNKALIAVPNHLVLQWGAEAQRLYPNARILCAGRKDCERKKRQRLFARIATGEWDLVIIAHSSFKFIQPPKSAQLSMLDTMSFEISRAMADADESSQEKNSDGFRRLQKRLENIRAKMKRLIEAPRRDGFIEFDQLGIDHITIDEAQDFKNLFYFTSFHGTLGLGPAEGSQQAFDLFCKARWLQDRYEGRGLTLLTGTPLSNTVAELWHFLRYLAYPELEARGAHTFDAWARVYAQPTAAYELSVSGQYKLVTRFQSFQNVPELMALYRHHANVVTKEDLAEHAGEWRLPPIRGRKPELVICERSEATAEYMDEILDRCNNLQGMDPRLDNMLKIMSDSRKAALDIRLVDPDAPGEKVGKPYQCALRVLDEYLRWNEQRGTQLVFCDLSVPNAHSRTIDAEAEDDSDDPDGVLASIEHAFSVYEEIKRLLVGWGVPAEEVAFAHDATTDEQKFALQERVRQGKIRVLIGSTRKMGTGMNVQDRLVALHDLDAPWRPSDLEQRLGRIERCGNLLFEADPDNFEIAVYRYGTERTLDARMWQTLETKARFIEQVRSGSTAREIKDIGGQTEHAGAMKACLSGNPLILAHFEAQSELDRLLRQHRAHTRRQMAMQDRIRQTEHWQERLEAARQGHAADTARADDCPERAWEAHGNTYVDTCTKQIEVDVTRYFQRNGGWHCGFSYESGECLGQYRGFEVYAWRDSMRSPRVSVVGDLLDQSFDFKAKGGWGSVKISGHGLCRRMDNAIARLDDLLEWEETKAEQTRKDRESIQQTVHAPFKHTQRMKDLKVAVRELTASLSAGQTTLPKDVTDVTRAIVRGAAESSQPADSTDSADYQVLELDDVLSEHPAPDEVLSEPAHFGVVEAFNQEPEQRSLFG